MRGIRINLAIIVVLLILVGCGTGSINQEATASALVSTEPLTVHVLSDSGNPVLELIADSYSASAFVEGEIEDSDIERILTCGAKAPSAKNAQPWHFTVIRNDETNARLLNQAKSGNVIIVISGKLNIVTDTMQFDCGLATQNMQLAAEALGLGARIFIEPVSRIAKQRDSLGIPEGYDVLAVLLIGFTDDSMDAVTSATPRDVLGNHVNYIH